MDAFSEIKSMGSDPGLDAILLSNNKNNNNIGNNGAFYHANSFYNKVPSSSFLAVNQATPLIFTPAIHAGQSFPTSSILGSNAGTSAMMTTTTTTMMTTTMTASSYQSVIKDEVDPLDPEEHGLRSLESINQLKDALMEVETSVASSSVTAAAATTPFGLAAASNTVVVRPGDLGAVTGLATEPAGLFTMNQADFLGGGYFVPSHDANNLLINNNNSMLDPNGDVLGTNLGLFGDDILRQSMQQSLIDETPTETLPQRDT